MVNVIGVRFENAGKLYFFDPGEFWPTAGDYVVVETSRGVELGEVVLGVREVNDEALTEPLKKVVRIGTAEDIAHREENRRYEKEALDICQQKVAEHKLDMKLVRVEYTLDNSKLLFYFTANGRVDFRALVKDLAGVFHTRIELRQIGVRDEAKMLGGLGPCGRPICCGTFLGDFQPVSIKMAKDQNLSLNPTKISGVCGRLMCCLKYEEDTYEQIRKTMPRVGKEVMTPDGPGTVWDLNIVKETVRVRVQKGDTTELKDYPNGDVQRVDRQAPVRENRPEEPAPEENPAEQPEETVKPARRDRRRDDRNRAAGEKKQPEKQPEKETENQSGKQPEKEPEKKAEKPVNPWKQAVEAAMRAAQSGEAGE